MAKQQVDITSTTEQDQENRREPEAAAELKKKSGQAGAEGIDPSILTPGGHVRYGGGSAQGIPMLPDSEDSK